MKSIYQLTALIGNKSDGINDEKFMTAAWILYAWMRREVIDCIPLPISIHAPRKGSDSETAQRHRYVL